MFPARAGIHTSETTRHEQAPRGCTDRPCAKPGGTNHPEQGCNDAGLVRRGVGDIELAFDVAG